jgi:hypothetical protein
VHDRIPQPDPLDGAAARLQEHAAALGTALAVWGARDDSKAQPEVTGAGTPPSRRSTPCWPGYTGRGSSS